MVDLLSRLADARPAPGIGAWERLRRLFGRVPRRAPLEMLTMQWRPGAPPQGWSESAVDYRARSNRAALHARIGLPSAWTAAGIEDACRSVPGVSRVAVVVEGDRRVRVRVALGWAFWRWGVRLERVREALDAMRPMHIKLTVERW